jgi:uncharacterized protein YhaN
LRLLALDLQAYGPFTGQRIDLAGGQQGLHILYGPNEAGKSSSLRALRALLFGIPARTADAFVHPYDQLRVGGRLLGGEPKGGRRPASEQCEIEVVRRKGNKGTLLAPDGAALPDDLIVRLMGGVEEEVFVSLFGLDHAGLVAGGQELLSQEGDVGQALFAAGLGTRSLRRVLRELDEEANALYLPRGAKPSINTGLKELAALRQEVRSASLSGSQLEGLKGAVESAEREVSGVAAELARWRAECNRLERLRRVLPLLAERRELLARLAGLGEVPVLPEDFPQQRREASDGVRTAREIEARATERLSRLTAELASLADGSDLIAQAETIERLHQGLSQYTKGLADRSRLLGQQEELLAVARDLLSERWPNFVLDEAETLRPALARWPLLQDLDARFEVLEAEQVRVASSLREAESRGEQLRAALQRLEKPPDVAGLGRAVAAARKAGDLDRVCTEDAAVVAEGHARLQAELRLLAPWAGSAEELAALPIPTPETVAAAEAALARLAERRRHLALRTEEAQAECAALDQELEELRRSGAVPSEEDLVAARVLRDGLWTQVRTLLGGALESGDPAPLAAAHERAVAAADEVADRLRREADRVQRQARLLARRHRLDTDLASLSQGAEETTTEGERVAEDWRALWAPCGFLPRPPAEMRAWLGHCERLRGRTEELRQARRRLTETEATRAEHRAALAGALAQIEPRRNSRGGGRRETDGRLAVLLDAAEARLREIDEASRAYTASSERLRESEVQLAAARESAAAAAAARGVWREQWAAAVQGLGLGAETSPVEVRQIRHLLEEMFSRLNEAAHLDRRITGITRDCDHYRAEVAALTAYAAPQLAGRPVEQAVVELHNLLTQARGRAELRAALNHERERLSAEQETAAAGRRLLEGRLAELRRLAGGGAEADLELVERQAGQASDLREALARVERSLLEMGEGAALDELERDAAGAKADALSAELELAARHLEEHQGRYGDLRETLGSAQRELRALEAGVAEGRAAEASGRAEETLARLRGDVEQYARLRLAAALLRQQIERYRAENQTPLLQRAGALFAELTLGSFAGLVSDFDERDRPVLAGCRPDGRRARVEQMSDGTRDQLYLALRLATLERYLETSEPLPLVIDDVLINFDDARSAATLRVLAALAEKTQVLLFTHHAKVRDLALEIEAPAGVFIQELAREGAEGTGRAATLGPAREAGSVPSSVLP